MFKKLTLFSVNLQKSISLIMLGSFMVFSATACGASMSQSQYNLQYQSANSLSSATKDDRPRFQAVVQVPVNGAFHPGR